MVFLILERYCMSNLVPTPIIDKNGKQTTVRKKTGGTSKSRVSALSVPLKYSVEYQVAELKEQHEEFIASIIVEDGRIKSLAAGNKFDFKDFYGSGGYYIYEKQSDKQFGEEATYTILDDKDNEQYRSASQTVDFIKANWKFDSEKAEKAAKDWLDDRKAENKKADNHAKNTEKMRLAAKMSKAAFDNWFEHEAKLRKFNRY